MHDCIQRCAKSRRQRGSCRRDDRKTAQVIIEIVILALIAAFLGLRLYSVLGRRAEHEEEPVPTRFERGDSANAPRAAAPASAPELPRSGRDLAGFPPAIEQGLRDISVADRRFDLLAFL